MEDTAISAEGQIWFAEVTNRVDENPEVTSDLETIWEYLLSIGMEELGKSESGGAGVLKVPLSPERNQDVYFVSDSKLLVYSFFAELGQIHTQVALDLADNRWGLFVMGERYGVGTTLIPISPAPLMPFWHQLMVTTITLAAFADQVEEKVSGMADKY